MGVVIAPSPVIDECVTKLLRMGLTEGLGMAQDRETEFGSNLEATLTGVALDPLARPVFERALDEYWEGRGPVQLRDTSVDREVIVGSGFHAAVYAATRVRLGYPRPIVLERGSRVGGTFAMTSRPTFYLNSRNRPGPGGTTGDAGASLNYIPSGIIQPSNVGMTEFQSNVDMALAIRWTLAQYADVYTGCTFTNVGGERDHLTVDVNDETYMWARVIDARGLGDPIKLVDSERVLSFPGFMQRMEQPWPLQGVRRVAVLGDGDSAKCAVESLVGLAPQPYMSCAALDHVERIDWYAPDLPVRCKDWRRQTRGRYASIGHYLRADRYGVRRINVINRGANVLPTGDGVLVEGNFYDLAIACVGNAFPRPLITNLTQTVGMFLNEPFAKNVEGADIYTVGPAADLAWNPVELERELNTIAANRVSMWRTGPKTAALAASLGPTSTPLPPSFIVGRFL